MSAPAPPICIYFACIIIRYASYNLAVLKLLSHAKVYHYYEIASYATVLCLQLL